VISRNHSVHDRSCSYPGRATFSSLSSFEFGFHTRAALARSSSQNASVSHQASIRTHALLSAAVKSATANRARSSLCNAPARDEFVSDHRGLCATVVLSVFVFWRLDRLLGKAESCLLHSVLSLGFGCRCTALLHGSSITPKWYLRLFPPAAEAQPFSVGQRHMRYQASSFVREIISTVLQTLSSLFQPAATIGDASPIWKCIYGHSQPSPVHSPVRICSCPDSKLCSFLFAIQSSLSFFVASSPFVRVATSSFSASDMCT
jgi:hypothetical protein